jgi:hypothetical protein
MEVKKTNKDEDEDDAEDENDDIKIGVNCYTK